MNSLRLVLFLLLPALFLIYPSGQDQLLLPNEKHLRNIKQLTFGGENAEAYFSADGKQLILQSTRDGRGCDQIYTMNVDGSDVKMVSNGEGRTTCSYFFPGANESYIRQLTWLTSSVRKTDFSQGYVWAVYPGFDVFTAKPDGSEITQLTSTSGYDAETTITRDGKKLVFTSMRDGDLDVYTMDADGKHVKRLTNELGYDGGPFWSYDGKQIVYRAHHPKTDKDKADYTKPAEAEPNSTVGPRDLGDECRRSNKRQVTSNGKANFGPYFFPDGKRIIFSSNIDDPGGRNFDLYKINVDGTGLERITFNDTFDGVSNVSTRWKETRVCVEPQRESARRDQRVHS